MKPPRKPLLIYDGDCDFCRSWLARWRRVTGDRLDYATSQEVAPRFPEIPAHELAEAVQLLESDGRRTAGAEAVFRALAHAPGHGWPLALYRFLPGFALGSRAFYRLVARHRPFFLRLTRWIWGDHLVPPGNAFSTWVFVRCLALVYAVAFLSLWIQIRGLVGHDGILPAADFLEAVRARYGGAGAWLAPTVLWWVGAGDGVLVALCAAGVGLAILLLVGFVPVLCLAGLWVCYLSLASVGRDFLWFQWDGLLLEIGFLALFLAPLRLWSRPASDPPPRTAARALGLWLLYRLMFSSAAVKWTSGDPAWRDLTALAYHYETQPLPPWTAWYAHHLPLWFHRASCVAMFAIEGVIPFLLFGPRRIRFAAAAAIATFQALILISGNYGFFNWLTLALCVLVVDDGVWPTLRRWRWNEPASPRSRWPAWIVRPAAVALVALSLIPLAGAVRAPLAWLGPLTSFYAAVDPLRIVNPYGLFAIMTRDRPEIVIEGSDDGRTWMPYEFRYKPGDLSRRPAFVAPMHPRLDWQMWFAALGDYRREPWFLYFCQRLLEGSPPVLGLLERNPFPRAPPLYLRAVVYEYRFTDAATRRATGAWWRRDLRGLYCPLLTLRDGRLVPVVPESGGR